MTSMNILLLTTLVVVSLLALGLLATGIGMTLAPGRINPSASPWRMLDRQWYVERIIYRHHRLTGLLIVLGAGLFLRHTVGSGIPAESSRLTAWQPLWWLLTGGNAVNVLIGLIIMIRPSLLRALEQAANRWIAVDRGIFEQGLRRHPRLRGLLIVLLSLVALASFGLLLAEQLPG